MIKHIWLPSCSFGLNFFPIHKRHTETVGVYGHQRPLPDLCRDCHRRVLLGFILFSSILGKLAGFIAMIVLALVGQLHLHPATQWVT